MHRGSGIILRNPNNEVLIVFGEKAKKYSFPKGHKYVNETYEQCAIRETKEETGLDVCIPNGCLAWSTGRYVYYFLTMDNVTGDTNLFVRTNDEDISHAKWVPISTLENLECNGDIRKYIKNI